MLVSRVKTLIDHCQRWLACLADGSGSMNELIGTVSNIRDIDIRIGGAIDQRSAILSVPPHDFETPMIRAILQRPHMAAP